MVLSLSRGQTGGRGTILGAGHSTAYTGCHKYVPFARLADWRQSSV
jgi:hypothetical protein